MKAAEISVIRRMNRPDLEGRYIAAIAERDELAAALRAMHDIASQSAMVSDADWNRVTAAARAALAKVGGGK